MASYPPDAKEVCERTLAEKVEDLLQSVFDLNQERRTHEEKLNAHEARLGRVERETGISA